MEEGFYIHSCAVTFGAYLKIPGCKPDLPSQNLRGTLTPRVCAGQALGEPSVPWVLRSTDTLSEAKLALRALAWVQTFPFHVLFNKPLANSVPRHYKGHKDELRLPSSEKCKHIMKLWQCYVIST